MIRRRGREKGGQRMSDEILLLLLSFSFLLHFVPSSLSLSRSLLFLSPIFHFFLKVLSLRSHYLSRTSQQRLLPSLGGIHTTAFDTITSDSSKRSDLLLLLLLLLLPPPPSLLLSSSLSCNPSSKPS